MLNLKNNFYLYILISLASLSCSILRPSYKVLKVSDGGIEILFDTKRAYATCEDASGDDKVYILLLHVLNDINSVDNFVYAMAHPKEDCLSFKGAIDRVLANGNQIYLAGSGSGQIDLQYKDESYTFETLGQFPFSKRVFGFRMIKNEKGQCYRFGVGDEKDGSCN